MSSASIAAARRGRTAFFESLPRDVNRIAVHSMVADLASTQQTALQAYLIGRFPGSPEVADALLHVAAQHRTHLRTKELIETVESFVHAQTAIQNALTAARKNPGRCTAPSAIYDMACGHGKSDVSPRRHRDMRPDSHARRLLPLHPWLQRSFASRHEPGPNPPRRVLRHAVLH
jgi:hypothetical protein